MKRLLALIMTICLLMVTAVAFAEAEYPEENYEMYYMGNRNYPIVFAHMGTGYVLDKATVRTKGNDTNEIFAEIHEVDMNTNVMKANPMHVYTQYYPNRGSFIIGLADVPNAKAEQLYSFDYTYLDKGTSQTGLLFPAGRAIWEVAKAMPLYPDYPLLKPVGEPGGPALIKVNATTAYARLDYDKAEVNMQKASGLESYTISFRPDHFIITAVYADNPEIEARLRREEVGTVMYYNDNPRVRLVANYLGMVPNLTREQLNAVGAY